MTKREHLSTIRLCKILTKDINKIIPKMERLEKLTESYWISAGIFEITLHNLKETIREENIELNIYHNQKETIKDE